MCSGTHQFDTVPEPDPERGGKSTAHFPDAFIRRRQQEAAAAAERRSSVARRNMCDKRKEIHFRNMKLGLFHPRIRQDRMMEDSKERGL